MNSSDILEPMIMGGWASTHFGSVPPGLPNSRKCAILFVQSLE